MFSYNSAFAGWGEAASAVVSYYQEQEKEKAAKKKMDERFSDLLQELSNKLIASEENIITAVERVKVDIEQQRVKTKITHVYKNLSRTGFCGSNILESNTLGDVATNEKLFPLPPSFERTRPRYSSFASTVYIEVRLIL